MVKTNFIEDCLAGVASLDNLDEYIEYWHTHETGNELREFLGMTAEEYSQWVKYNDKEFLQIILEARKEQHNAGA